MEVPTKAELRKLKVVELRQKLSNYSLPLGGVKEDLIKRLIAHYKRLQKEPSDGVEEERPNPEDEEEENSDSEETLEAELSAESTEKAMPHVIEPPENESSQVKSQDIVSPALPVLDTPNVPVLDTPAVSIPNTSDVPILSTPALPILDTPVSIPKTSDVPILGTPALPIQETPAVPIQETPAVPILDTSAVSIPKNSDVPILSTPAVPILDTPVSIPNTSDVPVLNTPVPIPDTYTVPIPDTCTVPISSTPAVPIMDTHAIPKTRTIPIADNRTVSIPDTHTRSIPYTPHAVSIPSLFPMAASTAPVMPPPLMTTPPAQVTAPPPAMPPSLMDITLPQSMGMPLPLSSMLPSAQASSNKPQPRSNSMAKSVKSKEGAHEEKEAKKKKKRKKKRRRRHDQQPSLATKAVSDKKEVEIEYVQENVLKPGDPNYRQFHKILESFRITEPEELANEVKSLTVSELVAEAAQKSKLLAIHQPELSSDEDDDEQEEPKMSKKKLRKLNRLSVAQLKQLVERPDLVEMHDVSATDPKLLIHLKSTRNTVPVPRHWCFKRKYLQGKRGIEKSPFNLPDFIKDTGVMEMRQALEEKEDAKSLKQKTKERVRPKMGKLTIDYQKLHDAFFKWQTKPKMSIHGDLYYEGKEFETRLRQKKPGDLSDDLRKSLGMPTGFGKQKFPPPWLVAMQRYGPPPSYPNLRIPGLNSPIPDNCSFGYYVGGWGKPPVDSMGRPLYGDVFGLEHQENANKNQVEEEVDKSFWGELESEEEESEDEEEDESDKEGSPKPDEIAAGLVTPMEGLVTPSGLTSIPAGMETPDMIQLRKKKIEEAMEQGGETPSLYTVIPEKMAAVGGAMMGSSHVYELGASAPAAGATATLKKANTIELALDPSELDLDTATMSARYEEQVREQRNMIQKEDLSDMVAEHAAKQKKRKRTTGEVGGVGGKATKKLKEFKF